MILDYLIFIIDSYYKVIDKSKLFKKKNVSRFTWYLVTEIQLLLPNNGIFQRIRKSSHVRYAEC